MLPKTKSSRVLLLLLLSLVLTQSSSAADQMMKWRCSGVIRPQGELRYKAVFLPEIVYEYAANDLRDLRITNDRGEALPYIIEHGFKTTKSIEFLYHSRLLREFKKKGDSYFDFAVLPEHEDHDISGNKLRINLPRTNFLKEIEVYGSHDGVRWEYLSLDQIYRIDNLSKDSILLKKTERYSHYRLKVLQNVENIKLHSLQVIDLQLREDWEKYQKRRALDYQIKNEESETVITIDNRQNLKICGLNLETEGNFRRSYKLYSSTKSGSSFHASGEVFNLGFADYFVSETLINLEEKPSSSPFIKIEIENLDNTPLKIKGITGAYYLDKIIFEDSGSEYYLLFFGNPQAKQPRYDWEEFRSHIIKEEYDPLELTAITVKPVQEHNTASLQWILNGIILLTSVILILVLIKKLSQQPSLKH